MLLWKQSSSGNCCLYLPSLRWDWKIFDAICMSNSSWESQGTPWKAFATPGTGGCGKAARAVRALCCWLCSSPSPMSSHLTAPQTKGSNLRNIALGSACRLHFSLLKLRHHWKHVNVKLVESRIVWMFPWSLYGLLMVGFITISVCKWNIALLLAYLWKLWRWAH